MRKFLIKVLSFILFINLIYIIASFSVKNLMTGITNLNPLRGAISNKVVELLSSNLTELNSSELNSIKSKIVNDPRINTITNKYMDQLLIDLQNNTISKVDIKDELNSIIVDNLDMIPPSFTNYILNKLEVIDFTGVYENLYYYVKEEIGINVKPYLKVLNYFTNILLKIVAILISIVNIVLIIILSKPKNECLFTFGMLSLVLGFLLLLLSIFIKKGLSYIEAAIGVDFTYIFVLSFVFMIIGYILKEIYEKKICKAS